MAETAEQQRDNGERSVTVTSAAQIWICGRGCGKTAATAMTTRWQSKLGLALASAKEMTAAKLQQHWWLKLSLQDLVAVAAKRRQIRQDKNGVTVPGGSGGREVAVM